MQHLKLMYFASTVDIWK